MDMNVTVLSKFVYKIPFIYIIENNFRTLFSLMFNYASRSSMQYLFILLFNFILFGLKNNLRPNETYLRGTLNLNLEFFSNFVYNAGSTKTGEGIYWKEIMLVQQISKRNIVIILSNCSLFSIYIKSLCGKYKI